MHETGDPPGSRRLGGCNWDNAHLARCRSAGIAIGATPFAPGAPLAEMVALPRDRKPFPIALPRAWPAAGEAGTGALT